MREEDTSAFGLKEMQLCCNGTVFLAQCVFIHHDLSIDCFKLGCPCNVPHQSTYTWATISCASSAGPIRMNTAHPIAPVVA